MKIVSITDAIVPIRSSIRNAFIDFSQMTTSVVRIETDVMRSGKPVVGYGFNSNGRYEQSGILRTRMIPRLMNTAPESLLDQTENNLDPFKAWEIMMTNEKPGGHGERSVAVAAVDMALWDVIAKIEEKPLYQVLADRYNQGQAEPEIFVYAAGGYYYPGKDLEALKDEMQSYLDMGYQVVKIKIGGTSLEDDLKRIEAVLSILGDGQSLAVDANGRFDTSEALQYAQALEAYPLFWYEEPGDPLDFQLNAKVAQMTSLPVATGENIFSLIDATNLIRYGGLRPEKDYLQFDPALGYGLVEYVRILQMLKEAGWSWKRCIPHGGHQLTLHIAAGLGLGGNEFYPHVFKPFGGFGDSAEVINGYVRPPDVPGIGFETKSELMACFDTVFK